MRTTRRDFLGGIATGALAGTTAAHAGRWLLARPVTSRVSPMPPIPLLPGRVPDEVVEAANRIRIALHFDVNERRRMPTWIDALRNFIEQADGLGILVMCNGVVHNNNHRHLDPEEFRGFAMADDLAPLVFINGADTKAAQMFTLAHELAHIWLGQSAVSDAQPAIIPDQAVERWGRAGRVDG